ncbi:MAG TPA: ADOP family duplicated permease [Thermoanaerobaculia bacterium]|nr:ADOP family duplicated permease [Thermoanaerobaculia bacterium]
MIRLLRAMAARLLPSELQRRFGARIDEDLARAWRRHAEGRALRIRTLIALRLAVDIVRNSVALRGRSRARAGRRVARAWSPIWRWALKALSRRPASSAVVVATVSLTVAAAVAVFGMVHAEVLRPLPYADERRLIVIGQRYGDYLGNLSALDLRDLRDQTASLTAVTGFDDRKVVTIIGAGEPLRVTAAAVDGEFFRVLGTPALIGRTLGRADDRPESPPAVVISERLWRRDLGADPGIVGRDLVLDRQPHRIVGVMPAEFQIPDEEELWVPHALFPYGDDRRERRDLGYLEVVARLSSDADFAAVRSELDVIAGRLSASRPASEPLELALRELPESVAGPAVQIFPALVAAVVSILLIAAVDLGGLMAARMTDRRREMSVRVALGAGGRHLAAQLLAEGLLLALAGGALGLVLGGSLLEVLPRTLPGWFPRLAVVGVQPPVAVFGVGLIALLGVLLGLLPALPVLRSKPLPSAARSRLRLLSVGGQIAVAFAVLVAAGLLVRSFDRLVRVPVGFRVDGVLTGQIALPAADAESRDQVAFFSELLDALAGLPGVEAAGAVNRLPLTEGTSTTELEISGRTFEEPPAAHLRIATPGYLRALGIPLKAGRDIDETDRADSDPVALVDEALASRYWSGTEALGARLRTGENEPWRRVVGIVASTRHWGQAFGATQTIYLPHAQGASASMMIAMATAMDPAALAGPLRATLRELDPDLPVHEVRTMAELLAGSVALRRVSMVVFLFFSAVGLLLAGLGVYGTVASLVASRRHEIGVRMALGARAPQIVRGIVGRVVALTLGGLAAGTVLCWGTTRGLDSLLFAVSPLDPATLIVVALFVVLVALLAAAEPARRAAGVDPALTLRNE